MEESAENCVFCSDDKEYPITRNIFIYRQKYFSIISDISPVNVGHALIIPRRHTKSLASLTHEEYNDLEIILKKMLLHAKRSGQRVIFAEHGTGTDSSYSCACIDHAHLHVLPVEGEDKFSIEKIKTLYELEQSSIKLKSLRKLSDVIQGKSYLYFSSENTEHYLFTKVGEFHKQFFRFAAASTLSKILKEDHSWQNNIDFEEAAKTFSYWVGAFSNNTSTIRHINKLVRDKIPQIMAQKNQNPIISVLSNDQYKTELIKKLHEEVKELEENMVKEEFADVIEVLNNLINISGFSFDDVMRELNAKKKERGGFHEKIKLHFAIEK